MYIRGTYIFFMLMLNYASLSSKIMGNEFSRRKSFKSSKRFNNLAHTSSNSSKTSSMDSEKQIHRWDEGRRYHGVEGSSYALPNDDTEIDRLQMQHYMLRWGFNGLFKAPVKNLSMVLDVGCGPGTWTLEMAQAYPDIDVHGVDITPVFPSLIHPSNTHFHIGNVTARLPFPEATFDLVYQRLLILGLRTDEWPKAIQEIKRVCKPGGWIELVEIDMAGKNIGPTQRKIMDILDAGLRRRGLEPEIARQLGSLLNDGGFEDVVDDFVSLPIGWGGRIGDMMLEDTRGFLHGMEPILSKVMGIHDSEQYEREVVKALLDEAVSNKQFANFHYAYGRRPALSIS